MNTLIQKTHRPNTDADQIHDIFQLLRPTKNYRFDRAKDERRQIGFRLHFIMFSESVFPGNVTSFCFLSLPTPKAYITPRI